MKNIVIIGAGDLGREVVWLIEDINRLNPTYVVLGFLDDEKEQGGEYYGYKVLGKSAELDALSSEIPFSAVIAMQNGTTKRRIVEEHPDFDSWESIIHPTAVIASTSPVGKGSIAFPQVTISIDTQLGDFNLYYIHSIICNDCKIGSFVSLLSGVSVSERVKIGDESILAAGSCVYPHKKIGNRVKVSVGTIVSRDYGDDVEINEKTGGFSLFK